MKAKQKPTRSTTPTKKRYDGFSDAEKEAMKNRVQEMKTASRGQKVDEESLVLAKFDEMPEGDRAMGKRLHTLIKAAAPALSARLWYGMPAYYRDGKLVCHFQPAQKFKTRYATLGFSDAAHLDEGTMWPNAYALTKLTAADEARIEALVKKAAG
ncbi:MAG TPA: DUF1801 domain-containing protein [Candidatus Sulfotelmatobacter sp.]|nr:DUF1801 domain-containing protein [Candidatus Sulfotelmatobacter sp.]